MAIHVLRSPIVTLSSVDITDHVESVEFTLGGATVPVTAFGATYEAHLGTGIKRWGCRVNLFQDYEASKTYALVYAVLASSTGEYLTVRPTTSTQSTTNPTFTGSVFVDGDFAVIGGAVGEANKTSVTFKGAGNLSALTSATA